MSLSLFNRYDISYQIHEWNGSEYISQPDNSGSLSRLFEESAVWLSRYSSVGSAPTIVFNSLFDYDNKTRIGARLVHTDGNLVYNHMESNPLEIEINGKCVKVDAYKECQLLGSEEDSDNFTIRVHLGDSVTESDDTHYILEINGKKHSPWLLFYHGSIWYGDRNTRPSLSTAESMDRKGNYVSDYAHNAALIRNIKGKMTKEQQYLLTNGFIVSFPHEYEKRAKKAKKAIEKAKTYETAIAALREFAHSLPCFEHHDSISFYHTTSVSPKDILNQGLYSYMGYFDEFGQYPGSHGQLSGDGVYTTLEEQGKRYPENPSSHYGWGQHQYEINLEDVVVANSYSKDNDQLLLSILHWYIKIRKDFGLNWRDRHEVIHDPLVTPPVAVLVQGLPEAHIDLGYDVIETRLEFLIKRKRIDPKEIRDITR